MRPIRPLVLAPLASLLLLLPACRNDDRVSRDAEGRLVLGTAQVEDETTRSVVPGGRLLVVEGFNGAVHLEGGTGDAASLTFTRIARGDDDAQAQERLAEIAIDEAGDDREYRYVLHSGDPTHTAVDVRGTLPRGARLRLSLDNGDVTLSGIEGPLEVKHQNGHLSIRGATESVRVEHENGDIDVEVRVLPPEGRIDLASGNGNVKVGLPETVGARVEARTEVGDIRVQGLTFRGPKLEPSTTGAQFHGTLGDGNAVVTVKVDNGGITLAGAGGAPPA